MANELVHASQGTTLTQAEFEAVGLHVCNNQATGDLIYASSATQLSRLGIGSAGQMLYISGGIPSWFDGLTFSNDGTKTTILGKTGDYNRIGDAATTAYSLASEDDLLVTGKLEVTSNAYFTYPVSIYNSFIIQTSNQGIYGNSTISEYYHLYGYDTGASGYQSALKITNAATITAQFAADLQLGFFGQTPAGQQTKATHNDWAAVGDVVNALVSLGLFDQA